jgi:hypothetical protein
MMSQENDDEAIITVGKAFSQGFAMIFSFTFPWKHRFSQGILLASSLQ